MVRFTGSASKLRPQTHDASKYGRGPATLPAGVLHSRDQTAVTRFLLKWLERALFAFGLVLGLWCAVVLVRAHQTQNMRPPKVTVTQTVLPGNTASPPVPVPAPAPGTWIARLEVPSVKLATTVLAGTADRTLSRGSGPLQAPPVTAG